MERTLGAGIRIVYLHVALTWTGMLGLYAAALLGLPGAIWDRRRLVRWAQAAGQVGAIFFAVSLAVSLLAGRVNWGGLAWREPRTYAMLQVLAATMIILVLQSWLQDTRLRGLLALFPSLLLTWSVWATPLQLHPQNPIGTSPSLAIRLTFYALFALFALAAAWLTLVVAARSLRSLRGPGE
jgi:magnesium-transporting ATPase (P-type)